jgi:hypothetical protein
LEFRIPGITVAIAAWCNIKVTTEATKYNSNILLRGVDKRDCAVQFKEKEKRNV